MLLRECKLDLGYQPLRGKTYRGRTFFSILTSFYAASALACGHGRRPCSPSLLRWIAQNRAWERRPAGATAEESPNDENMRICAPDPWFGLAFFLVKYPAAGSL